MTGLSQRIARRPAGTEVPLSFAQERLWYSHLLAPDSPVYNRPLGLRLSGPLNTAALRAAFEDVVARHEVVTSAFVTDGEGAVRAVRGEKPEWVHVDLQTVAPEDLSGAAQRLAVREARRPFDLATGPVARAFLVRLEADDHLLALTFHHIVFDGWSAGVVVRELGACYCARVAGRDPSLPELAIQHADVAVRERSPEHAGHIAHRLEHWREQLAGVRGLLELPTDRPRRSQRSFSAGRRGVMIPAELERRLRQLSAQHRATLYMTLLATYAVLLRGYTGEEDLVIGSPIAGRGRTELEGLIGCFINTLPLRIDLRDDPAFSVLLGRVRGAALSSFAHQDVPLQAIVEAVAPERDPNRPPLFQVLFNMRNLPRHTAGFGGLSVQEIEIDTGACAVELSLEVASTADGLRATMEFSTDLFEEASVDRMLRHYAHLLESIVADAGAARLSELPLMNPAELDVVVRSGAGPTMPREALCVHELIERAVDHTPEMIAVTFGNHRLTYQELDERANQLASMLRELGAGPGTTVGVFLPRSLDLTVALLAALKTGGTYLPLDPDYPAEQLAWMLHDAAPSVVLTHAALGARLPPSGGKTVHLDAEADRIAQQPTRRLPSAVRAADPAYVMFTSGSSGRPRGVVVPHACVVNHNLAVLDAFALKPSDRVLQFASPSFDASVEEIFPTWMAGATLVLRTQDMLGSARALASAVTREAITVLNLPTAFWHAWVGELARTRTELPASLRLLIIGGEKASSSIFRTWRELANDRVALLNTYGPTEATVVVSIWDPHADPVPAENELPIGRPIANTQLHVLDSRQRPVPFGVVGELHVGGAAVARGYLNQPQLTAERFVADPFGSRLSARLFRTGDRARRRSDGLLEFVGRVDRQVKLRGFRVEPEEVEAVLRGHADVYDAAVVLRQNTAGDAALVAYVVARGGVALDSAALKRWLRTRLPEFMVPAIISTIEALPRDGSGKIDPRALPDPHPISAAEVRREVRTPAERSVSGIFEEVLGLHDVAATDDFFELGGHSLLAIRLAARIEETFGRRFPLAMLLEGATVESIAARLERNETGHSARALVAIQPRGAGRPFFCVHEFFGDVLLYAPLARFLGPDVPFYGLQATSLHDVRDVADLAARYVHEIRAVQPGGPYALGGLCAGGLVALEMAQQLTAAGDAVELLALLDTSATPFSWRRGPQPLWSALRGVPDWLEGLRQLTPAQRRQLLRLTVGDRVLSRNGGRRSSRTSGGAADHGSRVIASIADALGISEDRRRIAAAFRRMLLEYTPRPYHGRAVLFRPLMQPLLDRQDEAKGWRVLVRGGFEVRHVPGNHLAMLQEPHVRALARELQACLQAVRNAAPEAAPRPSGPTSRKG